MNSRLRLFENTGALISGMLDCFRETFPTLGETDGIMLAGGRTPLEIYRRTAAEGLSTAGKLFLSDERAVPVADPQSNYGTIAPFFPALEMIRTDQPLETAAQIFDDALRTLERIPLGLLGLGADGHTASLFTLEDAALRDERLAIPVIKAQKPDRISVTPTLLRRIERIVIVATGAEKREIIQTLLATPSTTPAGTALAGHPHIELWSDQAVAPGSN
jgi:6-phosphogluconolactonase